MISLWVGILGVIIASISVIQAKRSGKKDIRKKIAEKQARLDVLSSKHLFSDETTMNNTMIECDVLKKEIEELKKQL